MANNKIIENPQQIQMTEGCLKATLNFKGSTYQNVCDGSSYYVPNGSLDYVSIGLMLIIGIVVVSLFGAMARAIFKD